MKSILLGTSEAGGISVQVLWEIWHATSFTAFIDSGNLAIDPMDMNPVVLIKRDLAKKILPSGIVDMSDIDSLDRKIKKKIRLIPITRGGATHVLVGVKADCVKVMREGNSEEITITLAVDKEGGTFDGYDALMPSAAISNVFS